MTSYTCPRCDGTGHFNCYSHVQNGVCFKCNGTGKVSRKPAEPKPTKITPERQAYLDEWERKRKAAFEIYRDKIAKNMPFNDFDIPEVFGWALIHAYEHAVKDGIWDQL